MDLLSAVRWVDLPSNVDSRGVLTSIESGLSYCQMLCLEV